PWTRAGMRNVIKEFWQGIRYLRLPPGGPGKDGGLAGFIHGLGLLAITAMVTTGATFYFSRLAGAGRDTLEIIEDIHDTFAVIAWIYWGGHLAAATLHSLLRQPILKRMFSLEN
ncbi:MAG: cytochrome b/b6 domain-containing protein, partial [Gammaproteobacteria bacterium]